MNGKQTFLQKKKHADGQQTHEKILNIVHYWRNAIETYSALVIVAIIKQSTNNKWWRGYGGKGTPPHCWWECKLVQPLWKTVWGLLKKLTTELPYDPVIPFLGTYLDKTII